MSPKTACGKAGAPAPASRRPRPSPRRPCGYSSVRDDSTFPAGRGSDLSCFLHGSRPAGGCALDDCSPGDTDRRDRRNRRNSHSAFVREAGAVILYAALRPSTERSANHRRDGLADRLSRGLCRLLSGTPRRSSRPIEGSEKRVTIRSTSPQPPPAAVVDYRTQCASP